MAIKLFNKTRYRELKLPLGALVIYNQYAGNATIAVSFMDNYIALKAHHGWYNKSSSITLRWRLHVKTSNNG